MVKLRATMCTYLSKHGRTCSTNDLHALMPFAGSYASSQRSGQGIMLMPDGGIYQGSFADDKFSGEGQYRYADGSTYVGAWKAGKKHGQVSAEPGLLYSYWTRSAT